MSTPEPPRPNGSTSEERLRALSELAKEYAYTATFATDGALVLDWATPNCERTFGVSAGAEFRAEALKGLVPSDDHAALDEWVQHLTSGYAAPLEHRCIDPNGKVHWVYHFAQVTPSAGRLRIDGAALDITERKLAELALAQSEERFRTLAEHASDLLVEINAHGRIVYVNPALGDILGWSPEMVIGTRVFSRESKGFVHQADAEEAQRAIRAGMERPGFRSTGRSRLRHSDGSWRWLEFSNCTYPTAEGLHQILIGRDVTDEVELEDARRAYAERLKREVAQRTEELQEASAQLRQLHSRYVMAEKLGDADELATSLARAINGPLAALLGRVEMELESPQPSRDGLRRILLLAERIQSVVASTLTLFREGRMQLADAHVHELLKSLNEHVADAAHARGVELLIVEDPDLPVLFIDRALLLSALTSIVENGLHAMTHGGSLRVHAAHLRDLEIVEFRIADQGSGIAAKDLPHVFEPFYTTKRSGTGLGLTIANGVVRGHRGQIEVHTHVGVGTRVDVRIPYSSLECLRRPRGR